MSSDLSDLVQNVNESSRLIPPGFRFQPTDEELVSYYLMQKVVNSEVAFEAIGEVNFNKVEPWDLPVSTQMGERELYFFSWKKNKYHSGIRTNRATKAGYWKSTGRDRPVTKGKLWGVKKTLVFYKGRARREEKTAWIMHKYRMEGESTARHQLDWVICRVSDRTAPLASRETDPEPYDDDENCPSTECLTDVDDLSKLPAPEDRQYPDLEPSSPISVNCSDMRTGVNLSDPQGYSQRVTDSGHKSHESMLGRSKVSNATMEGSELGFCGTVDKILNSSYLDGFPLDSIHGTSWDVNSGPTDPSLKLSDPPGYCHGATDSAHSHETMKSLIRQMELGPWNFDDLSSFGNMFSPAGTNCTSWM